MISLTHYQYKTWRFFLNLLTFNSNSSKCFSKISAPLIFTLKISTIYHNRDNSSKCINEYEINLKKKRLNEKNENTNEINCLSFYSTIAFIELE